MNTQSLQNLREEQLNFFSNCLKQTRKHPLLRNKKPNSGYWLGMLERSITSGLGHSDAELYVIGLAQDWDWPWKNRAKTQKEKDIHRWIRALSSLNAEYPILGDIHEDFFDWLFDIFNYIPREIWTAVTRLIAAIVHNSRTFKTISESSWGLCDDFDSSLNALMPLNLKSYKKPKSIYTSKGIFTAMGSSIKGNHSHSHRHGLYLLWWTILYDPQRHKELFSENNLIQPLLDIADPSCLTVLYVSILDILFSLPSQEIPFETESEEQFDSFPELKRWRENTKIPKTYSLSPAHKQICRDFIQNRILNQTWNSQKLDAQRFVELDRALTRAHPSTHTDLLYLSLQKWLSMDKPQPMADIKFDLLSEWIHRRISIQTAFCTASPLEERYQQLVAMNEHEKIQIFSKTVQVLTSMQQSKCLSSESIKRYFFDYWLLVSEKSIFQDERFYILNYFSLVEDSILKTQDMERITEAPKEYNKEDFAQLLLILVLLQSSHVKNNELSHFVRTPILEPLFSTKTQNRLARVVSNLISQKKYSGLFTGLGLRFYYNLVQEKDTKKSFRYFVGLFTQNPNPDFYEDVKKNFDYSYHFMNHTRPTILAWTELCERFRSLDKKRDEILKTWRNFQAKCQASNIFHDDSIDFLGLSMDILSGSEEYEKVLSYLNTHHQKDFFQTPYPLDIFTNIVQQLRTHKPRTSLRDMEESYQWYQKILDDIKTLEDWMKQHKFYQSLNIEIPFERMELLKSYIQDGLFTPVQNICTDAVEFLLDEQHDDKMSWPERFLWISVVAKMLYETKVFYSLKNQCIELDKELSEAGFHRIQEVFHRKDKQETHRKDLLTAKTYWEYLHDTFGKQTKEIYIINVWMNQQLEPDPSKSIEDLRKTLKHSSLSEVHKTLLIAEQITLKPEVLGSNTYPILKQLINSSASTNTQNECVLIEDHNIYSLIRNLKMFDLFHPIYNLQKSKYKGIKRLENRGYFLPVILSYTGALTQLLDIGDGLVGISRSPIGIPLSIIAVVTGVVLHFGLPYYNLRRYGYTLRKAMTNTLPTFIVSVVSAVVFTIIWLLSYSEPISGTDPIFHFIWTYFFSEMVLASLRGAFSTE